MGIAFDSVPPKRVTVRPNRLKCFPTGSRKKFSKDEGILAEPLVPATMKCGLPAQINCGFEADSWRKNRVTFSISALSVPDAPEPIVPGGFRQTPAKEIGLLEYSDRIGGRLYTRALPGMPHVHSELGGMRYEPKSHVLVREVIDVLRLCSRTFPMGITRTRQSGPRRTSSICAETTSIRKTWAIPRKCPTRSVGANGTRRRMIFK